MKHKSDKFLSIRVRARDCFRVNDLAKSRELYARILSKQKKDLEALQMLGTLAQRVGQFDKAEKHYRAFLKINKKNHEVFYQLGTLLQSMRRGSEALSLFKEAVWLKQDFFDAWVAMGNLYAWSGKLGESIKAYHGAIKAQPSHPVPFCNLGNVLTDSGRSVEAYGNWEKALALDPGYSAAHSNMLLCLNYENRLGSSELYEAHRNWSETHLRGVERCSKHCNSLDPARKIRIAYVSPDFREHSVAYFIRPVIRCHDRLNFEVFIYSSVSSPDIVTAEIESLADQFRNISGIPDADVAGLIRNDRIDILVDLSGHTSGHRLLTFGRKPAPVQVTYLGYPNTTGLREIEYRITDSSSDPKGESEAFYTEKLVRMPNGFLCYEPPDDTLVSCDLPCIGKGYVTFGSFNYTAKIGSEVIDVWADILKAIPSSRLLLKYRSFSDASTRDYFQDMFITRGIDKQRIAFMGLTPDKSEHMAAYNSVDIALDSFPYNGTTTTCDALWMGVPVVVVKGSNHAGRVGVSLLRQVGVEELVADSIESYVALATGLADDKEQLVKYRHELRNQVKNSSLCDADSFVKELEQVWRTIWRDQCNKGVNE